MVLALENSHENFCILAVTLRTKFLSIQLNKIARKEIIILKRKKRKKKKYH